MTLDASDRALIGASEAITLSFQGGGGGFILLILSLGALLTLAIHLTLK